MKHVIEMPELPEGALVVGDLAVVAYVMPGQATAVVISTPLGPLEAVGLFELGKMTYLSSTGRPAE